MEKTYSIELTQEDLELLRSAINSRCSSILKKAANERDVDEKNYFLDCYNSFDQLREKIGNFYQDNCIEAY